LSGNAGAFEGLDDLIEAMAAALVRHAGPRAGEIASRQLALSDGAVAVSWAAILDSVRQLQATPCRPRDIGLPNQPIS
jgi:hypothetical protein